MVRIYGRLIQIRSRGDLTLTASWTANSDTVYTVKHIKENLDGSYPADAAETEPLAGMTGANAAVTLKSYEGFGAGTYTNTVIAADGSTVVEVYYPRNSYTVTWLDFDGLTQLGTDIFKFEQIISVPDSAGTPVKRTGYTLQAGRMQGSCRPETRIFRQVRIPPSGRPTLTR